MSIDLQLTKLSVADVGRKTGRNQVRMKVEELVLCVTGKINVFS